MITSQHMPISMATLLDTTFQRTSANLGASPLHPACGLRCKRSFLRKCHQFGLEVRIISCCRNETALNMLIHKVLLSPTSPHSPTKANLAWSLLTATRSLQVMISLGWHPSIKMLVDPILRRKVTQGRLNSPHVRVRTRHSSPLPLFLQPRMMRHANVLLTS